MAWFGKYSNGYRQAFDAIFSPEWMHWVMHALLYAGLAIFMMLAFDLQVTKSSLGLVLAISLIIGGLQEGWQILSGCKSSVGTQRSI
jgi:VanZ family protein